MKYRYFRNLAIVLALLALNAPQAGALSYEELKQYYKSQNQGKVLAATAFDFSFQASGGHTVNQGNDLYIFLGGVLLSGSDTPIDLSVTGLPAGITYNLPDTDITCCKKADGTYFSSNTNFSLSLRLAASLSAPIGTYTIQVIASGGGVTRTVSYPVNVKAMPG